MTYLVDDYTEDDRYDWDRNDDSQYCQHGTFIGSWAGPDLLCGWCEDGISVAEMNAYYVAQRRREVAEVIKIHDAVQEHVPWSAHSLAWWMGYAVVLIEKHGLKYEELS